MDSEPEPSPYAEWDREFKRQTGKIVLIDEDLRTQAVRPGRLVRGLYTDLVCMTHDQDYGAFDET